MLVTIFTDASFCPHTFAAGWAAWIKYGEGKTLRLSDEFKINITNSSDAEIGAAVNALCAATTRLKLGSHDKIILQTDCLTVIAALDFRFKIDGGPRGFAGKCRGILNKRFEALGRPHIDIRHVKGHRGNADKRAAVNTYCDREARRHMRAVRARRQETGIENE
jgi:ribonuclease HI